MYPGSQVHQCAGEVLHLLPERAIYWPRTGALFLADLHLGKEQRFGRAGIPIPAGPSERDLARLEGLLTSLPIVAVYVLGDFMHARPRSDESWLRQLTALLDRHSGIRVIVVAGNHDRHWSVAGIDPRIAWHDEALRVDPFVLQHHPGDDPHGFVLSGHVHPAWSVPSRSGGQLKSPAFWFREAHAVLPAFSHFTAGARIKPMVGDQVFMTGPDFVLPVPHAALGRTVEAARDRRRRTRLPSPPHALDESIR